MATSITQTDNESTALTIVPEPQRVGMVQPLASAEQAVNAIQAYERLKSAIVIPSDIQRINGRDFLKKSFWRRVAACFGLSLELAQEEFLQPDEHGVWGYSVTYRAVAPNGRSMESDGMCMSSEKDAKVRTRHNVRATAHTRAKNRAISDLVGGGEVSAEEIEDEAPTPARVMVTEQRAARAAPKPEPEPGSPAAWDRLKIRVKRNGMIADKEAWEKLMEETGASYEETLGLVEKFEQHDLHDLGDGAKGRH